MPTYRDFLFPLNAYAHLLSLDYGGFDYLHYGLFEPGAQDVRQAQERASSLLFSRLPPAPRKILEVGIGIGTTLARLAAAGYEATGITPDRQQIEYARQRHGDGLPVVGSRLEDFTGGPFDLLLFQESAQYIDTATLFRKADALLAEGGEILIMDEMSLRRTEEPGLPLRQDYLEQAQAFGFETLENLDLSAQAAPTNDYILDALSRHRQNLIDALGIPAAQLEGLNASARRYAEKYADGRYGYGLLRFKKKTAGQTDWAGPEDEAAWLTLFRRAFGYDMDPALWRWKYAGLERLGSCLRQGGEMVAFYGGLPRPVSLFGQPAVAVQIGDVMVDPTQRGVLRRQGPFFRAAEHYLSACVGRGKPYALAFGFPAERADRLGERLGIYAKVGELMRVSWPALSTRPSLRLKVRTLDLDSQGAAVDKLWQEMAAALAGEIVGLRDAAYLHRRYLDHPLNRYRLHLVSQRLGGAPFGLIVSRELEGELEVLDFIAPPERMAALTHIARRLAWDLGKPVAYLWITNPFAPRLAGPEGTVTPTGIAIPALAWEQAIPPAEIQGHWWLTGGDTDFR